MKMMNYIKLICYKVFITVDDAKLKTINQIEPHYIADTENEMTPVIERGNHEI